MKRSIFFILAFVAPLSGCSAKAVQYSEWKMGTPCSVRFYHLKDKSLPARCFEAIDETEHALDVVKSTDEAAALNAGKTDRVSPLLNETIAFSLAVAEKTDGAFSPLLGRMTALWGFSSGQPQKPQTEEIKRLLPFAETAFLDYRKEDNFCTLKSRDTAFDFGAVGKGIASDEVSRLCEAAQTTALIDLGGNIQTVGSKPNGEPWRISLKSPLQSPPPLFGELTFYGSCAVSTSGDYQKFFYEDGVKYHHILDPKTGMPAHSGLRAVTVVSERSAAEADALSTALFVMGLEAGSRWAEKNSDIGIIWFTSDNRLYITRNLAERFTPSAAAFTPTVLPQTEP